MTPHRTDHGPFCTWKYNGPSKKARGFWHQDLSIPCPMWAYALRSPMGFWETSKAKGGFTDEQSAIEAARMVVQS